MKCLVCGKEYNGNECPVCGFPVVNITVNDEEGLKALRPTIDAHRAEFEKNIELSLLSYTYEVGNRIEPQGEERIPLGRVSQLSGQTVWLDTEFTNVVQRKAIPVTLCVTVRNRPEYRINVNAANILSDTIRVGICVNSSLQFCVIIQDSSGISSRSEFMPIVQ